MYLYHPIISQSFKKGFLTDKNVGKLNKFIYTQSSYSPSARAFFEIELYFKKINLPGEMRYREG